jgi:hypothetical protein
MSILFISEITAPTPIPEIKYYQVVTYDNEQLICHEIYSRWGGIEAINCSDGYNHKDVAKYKSINITDQIVPL